MGYSIWAGATFTDGGPAKNQDLPLQAGAIDLHQLLRRACRRCCCVPSGWLGGLLSRAIQERADAHRRAYKMPHAEWAGDLVAADPMQSAAGRAAARRLKRMTDDCRKDRALRFASSE